MGTSVNPSVAPAREAGVLLHPTSLPGQGDFGTFGEQAIRFIDFLHDGGQRLWQVLPLGPVHEELSPYQALSAFAGNPHLISREWLLQQLPLEQRRSESLPLQKLLSMHYAHHRASECGEAFEAFCREQSAWLDDYVLFRILRERFSQRPWNEWPLAFRDRHSESLQEVTNAEQERLTLLKYQQYIFYSQWHRVRRYANEKGVRVLGDMPIFVAYDSADVWASRDAFLLDEDGSPTVVAGVPPDYFSATGQRWGNPHYDWEWMEADGFRWWHRRIAQQLELFDLFRVDHFRGFEACWEVPAHEQTAMNGRWVRVPGDELFASLRQTFGELPIVAEDLGVITPEVTALRKKYGLPGMLILQFAFDSGADNPYLPHNHHEDSVVYTGTHDNDTTAGWFEALEPEQRDEVMAYLGHPGEPMPWALIECAYASVARQAIIPMQDWLGLGSEHRMNVPGVPEGNWRWRFEWPQVDEQLTSSMQAYTERYAR